MAFTLFLNTDSCARAGVNNQGQLSVTIECINSCIWNMNEVMLHEVEE